MNKMQVVITARGRGERMKAISPVEKHLLYYGGKRIYECIADFFAPFGIDVELLDGGPDGSRKETLELLRDRKNVLICDCDIIPLGAFDSAIGERERGFMEKLLDPDEICKQVFNTDAIWYFESENPKYGGLYQGADGALVAVVEKGDTKTNLRASGLYFLKDVGATIDRMTDENSIASGMIWAKMIYENTFVRLGDPEDYLNALK